MLYTKLDDESLNSDDSNDNINSPQLINSPMNKSKERKIKSQPITPPEYNKNFIEKKNTSKEKTEIISKQHLINNNSKTNSKSNLLILSK